MNDNRELLRLVHLDLHSPLLEAMDAMAQRRIRVRLKVPKTATGAQMAKSASLEVWGAPNNEQSPMQALQTALSDAVARYNERRRSKVRVQGTKVSLLPVEENTPDRTDDKPRKPRG